MPPLGLFDELGPPVASEPLVVPLVAGGVVVWLTGGVAVWVVTGAVGVVTTGVVTTGVVLTCAGGVVCVAGGVVVCETECFCEVVVDAAWWVCLTTVVAAAWWVWLAVRCFTATFTTTGCARLGIALAGVAATALTCGGAAGFAAGASAGGVCVLLAADGLVALPTAYAPPKATATTPSARTARPRAAGSPRPSAREVPLAAPVTALPATDLVATCVPRPVRLPCWRSYAAAGCRGRGSPCPDSARWEMRRNSTGIR